MAQFTIRDLLWLMVVAAVVCVCACDRCAIIAANTRICGQYGPDHSALYCCLAVIAVLVFALISGSSNT